MAGSLALGVGVVDVDIPPIIHGVTGAGGVGSLCDNIGAYEQFCIIYIRTSSIVSFLPWLSALLEHLTSCHHISCSLHSRTPQAV